MISRCCTLPKSGSSNITDLTIEQRADAVVDQYFGPDRAPSLRKRVAGAIALAIEDERERCAALRKAGVTDNG